MMIAAKRIQDNNINATSPAFTTTQCGRSELACYCIVFCFTAGGNHDALLLSIIARPEHKLTEIILRDTILLLFGYTIILSCAYY